MSSDWRPPTSQDEFLTVDEVAAILKLNPQTVRNWINNGTMPAVRVGRRVRITRRDLERVLTESYRPGSTAADAGDGQAFWDGKQDLSADIAE
jgi:excisionase family DNA binding protein